MSEHSEDLAQIVAYMRAHWPSQVKKEWQVDVVEYGESKGYSYKKYSGKAGRKKKRLV